MAKKVRELNIFTEEYGIQCLDEAEFTFEGMTTSHTNIGAVSVYRLDEIPYIAISFNSSIKLRPLFNELAKYAERKKIKKKDVYYYDFDNELFFLWSDEGVKIFAQALESLNLMSYVPKEHFSREPKKEYPMQSIYQ